MVDRDDIAWLSRQDAPAIARSLAAEIESNTCPICFELMRSPHFSPILLYPCGHTFCAKCLATHTVTNRKTTCPYCRQKIFSQALNLSLQKLINNFVSLQNTHLPMVDAFSAAEYSEKLQQLETRSQVLHCALQGVVESKEKLGRDIARTEAKLIESRSKEKETKASLDMLAREHQRAAYRVRQDEDHLTSMQRLDNEESAKLKLIQETMTSLHKECEKLRLLIV